VRIYRIYPHKSYLDFPIFTIDADSQDEAMNKYLERYHINKKSIRMNRRVVKKIYRSGKDIFEYSDFGVVEVIGTREIDGIAYYTVG
jgi:hypothetical protein